MYLFVQKTVCSDSVLSRQVPPVGQDPLGFSCRSTVLFRFLLNKGPLSMCFVMRQIVGWGGS